MQRTYLDTYNTQSTRTKSGATIPKFIIALLILSPLIYSNDGDRYRTYKLLAVSALFLSLSIPRIDGRIRFSESPLLYACCIIALIIIQPAFVPQVSMAYNVNFSIALTCCFIPALYASMNIRLDKGRDTRFLDRILTILFSIAIVSLYFSYFSEVGEIYTEGGSVRAFSWLGDSFSPVMVFFVFYYALLKRWVRFALAVGSLVFIMQAKMACGMTLFGFFIYVLIFKNYTIRLFWVGIFILCAFFWNPIFNLLSASIHNFDYSINNRLLSMDMGLVFFKSNPWFGVGANQTFQILSQGVDLTVIDRFEANLQYYEFFQIHNSFVRILAELGIFGFIFFFCFCFALVRKGYLTLVFVRSLHYHDRAKPLVISTSIWIISFVISYQTTGWFEPGHPQLSWLMVFFALMGAGSKIISNAETIIPINSPDNGPAMNTHFTHRNTTITQIRI